MHVLGDTLLWAIKQHKVVIEREHLDMHLGDSGVQSNNVFGVMELGGEDILGSELLREEEIGQSLA